MKKLPLLAYIFAAAAAIAGIFIGGYTGGMLTGFSFCLLVLAIVGARLAKKSFTRINKILRDERTM